jgi:hypothetical protein
MNGYMLATGLFAGVALAGELVVEGVPQSLFQAIQTPSGGEVTRQVAGPGTVNTTTFAGFLQTSGGQIAVYAALYTLLLLLASEGDGVGQITTAIAAALLLLFLLNHAGTLQKYFGGSK